MRSTPTLLAAVPRHLQWRGGLEAGAAGDSAWLFLPATPPHQEYPSGHTANSGAMTTVIGLLFGDAPGVPIQLSFSGVTREWLTLSEGLAEVIDARVGSGIHFRTAEEAGARAARSRLS